MSLRSKQIAVLAGLVAAGALWCVMGLDAPEPQPHHKDPEPAPSAARPRVDSDTQAAEELDPQSAQVLRQWQEALAPILEGAPVPPEPADLRRKTAVGGAGPSLALSPQDNAGREQAAQEPLPFDAGVPRDEVCRPGVALLPIPFARLDLVVAVDVSGSMGAHAVKVNQWIAALEPLLRQHGIDYRLHVLVDPMRMEMLLKTRWRGPKWNPPDAGTHVNVAVESHDVLDVLTTTPKIGTSWVSALRTNAAVHVVVVTDDDPEPRSMDDFVRRLTTFAEGRLGTPEAPAFGFHALLGMQPSAKGTLLADAPLEQHSCAVAAGIDYQRLVQQRGGLRGSLCDASSFDAFSRQLIAYVADIVSPADRCLLRLPAGATARTIRSVRALSRDGAWRQLRLAFDSWNCTAEDSYELQGTALRVCPDTCRAFQEGGFTTLEVTHDCEHPK